MMIILIYLTRKFTPLEPRDNFNFICGKETTMNGCKAFYKLGARLEAGVHQRAAFLRHAADERSMHAHVRCDSGEYVGRETKCQYMGLRTF